MGPPPFPKARPVRSSKPQHPACRHRTHSTVPHVDPSGESLLHLSRWRKVEKMLQAIDAVETLGIDPGGRRAGSLASRSHRRHVCVVAWPRTQGPRR
jgi:hypothetical protein